MRSLVAEVLSSLVQHVLSASVHIFGFWSLLFTSYEYTDYSFVKTLTNDMGQVLNVCKSSGRHDDNDDTLKHHYHPQNHSLSKYDTFFFLIYYWLFVQSLCVATTTISPHLARKGLRHKHQYPDNDKQGTRNTSVSRVPQCFSFTTTSMTTSGAWRRDSTYGAGDADTSSPLSTFFYFI